MAVFIPQPVCLGPVGIGDGRDDRRVEGDQARREWRGAQQNERGSGKGRTDHFGLRHEKAAGQHDWRCGGCGVR